MAVSPRASTSAHTQRVFSVRYGLSLLLVVGLGAFLHSNWTSPQPGTGPLSAIQQLVQGTQIAESADLDRLQTGLTEMQGIVSRIRTAKQLEDGPRAPGDLCSGGSWVLDEINASVLGQIEAESAQWYDDVPAILNDLYNNETAKTGPAPMDTKLPLDWKRFDVWMPSFPKACSLRRMGGKGDGGKWLCGIDKIPASKENPCIVYSIGSKNEWDFEEAIYRETSCIIHTFDCTVQASVPSHINDRVTFHPICVGNPATSTDRLVFKSYGQIMEMLGHSYVTLLKADIEGWEYSLFHELLVDDARLPEQISFELHFQTSAGTLDWFRRYKTPGEIAMLAERLYQGGYRTLSREDNVLCPSCSEFTVARLKCPHQGSVA